MKLKKFLEKQVEKASYKFHTSGRDKDLKKLEQLEIALEEYKVLVRDYKELLERN